MSFNTEEEKKALRDSLKNTENLHETLECLEHILHHRTPFALYVATADRSDCTWIFDPDIIYEMMGGEDKYNHVFNSLFETEEDRASGIVFLIFRKVGPIYSVRVELELINDLVEELYNDLSLPQGE
jgi:hypothetical protein